MTRTEMAFQIFLKRMAGERITDVNARDFEGRAEEALRIADVFIEAAKPTTVKAPEDTL